MRSPVCEMIDLALTQAIECYSEMEPDAAYDSIIADWPEQIAALLVEFLFKSRCDECGSQPDLIHLQREEGFSNYIVPMCSCEWSQQ